MSNVWLMEATALQQLVDTVGIKCEKLLSVRGGEVVGTAYKVHDGVAHIPITGVMLKAVPSWFAMFGIEATSTQDTQKAIENALSDSSVLAIQLDVDSPGGSSAGVMELANTVRHANKPTRAQISGMAASAAYWVASQADWLSATPGSTVGSIGAYTRLVDYTKALDEAGIKVLVVRSHELKGVGAGDQITDKQLASVQRNIDSLVGIFKADVTTRRSINDIDAVSTGEVWYAAEAQQLGLIDNVSNSIHPNNNNMDRNVNTQTLMEVAAMPLPNEKTTDAAELTVLVDSLRKQLEGQEKETDALFASQREQLIKLNSDRVVPAIADGVREYGVMCGRDLAKFEKFVSALPKVTHATPTATIAPEAGPGLSVGEKAAAAALGVTDRMLSKMEHVVGIYSNGQYLLDDGRVVDSKELE